MKLVKSPLAIAITASLFTFSINTFAEPTSSNDNASSEKYIDVITVTSDFRQQSLAQAPVSIAVIDQQRLVDEGSQHFAEVLNQVANINFSGGTSRPKYFQIRGVGERSEYRGAPNASVGFLVDDIDISGLGMAANMYDVQQVEILRGPQGTRFGANALAGLVFIKSNDPTDTFEHGMQATIGDDELMTLSGYSSGPITEKLTYRAVLQQHQQNGYRDNVFLNRDDTSGIDELTGKLKLRYQATDDLTINFTYLHADLDNGTDFWTLDNNGYTTLSDKPGIDTQNSKGSALKVEYTGFQTLKIETITSFSQTDHENSYDGDWANASYWADKECDDDGNITPCVYDYFWAKVADRKYFSQEFRFSSNEQSRLFSNTTDWLVGLYYSDLDEKNAIDSTYNGWPDEVVDSQYKATNKAIFAQLDSELPNDYHLSTGLRIEYRDNDYTDNLGDEFSPSETMWGGHIAISKSFTKNSATYIRLAKGYKAGGFNMGLSNELSQYKEFDTESLINYEIGMKSYFLDNSVNTNISAFYMDREDQQVNASIQNPDKPQRFIIYTANAASSSSYGVELDVNWQVNDQIEFYSSLGYLNATYDEYAYQDKYGSTIDISGRTLAHAPKLTYSAGTTYRYDNGLFANISVSGKSAFYFSDSHDEKSSAANIVNARIGYEVNDFSIYLWARNLLDKKVATRGFYFGNEPDLGWVNKKYIRYDAPRQLGLTLDYQF